MLHDSQAGNADHLGDRRARDVAMAFLDNVVPVHPGRDQLEDIAHQDARSPEREFAVAYVRIRRDESADAFGFHVEEILIDFSGKSSRVFAIWKVRLSNHCSTQRQVR